MEAEERERVPGLLLEAIESLREPDRKLVLAFLIHSALLTSRQQMVGQTSAGSAALPGFFPAPQVGPGGAGPGVPGATDWTIAGVMRMPDEALRAALGDIAPNTRSAEPTPSILRLLAVGRTRAEVASELGISEEQVTDELERPRPLAAKLLAALRTQLAERGGTAAQESTLGYLRTPGPAGQRLVPVRFPEEQHVRLKEWCANNGFSMAVVIRGLVDRFLEEYDPREA